jgi:hypothetical protein
LREGLECIRRLGVFWRSIEVDANPDLVGQDIDYDQIKSGPFLLMEYMVALSAAGADDRGGE